MILSAEEVYDRAVWKAYVIVHRPHIKVEIRNRPTTLVTKQVTQNDGLQSELSFTLL